MTGELLQVEQLVVRYGGLRAVDSVDFAITDNEIVSLIGPNGAGKTTIFKALTGFVKAEGRITFDGLALRALRPHQIAERGIVRTFQITSLFPSLSATENVCTGRHLSDRATIWDAILNTRRNKALERRTLEKADEILAFVGLGDLRDTLAGNMPYGKQRIVEIAVALAAEPKLLLLDEPSAGLNESETQGVMDLIKRIRSAGRSVLLVEHDMKLVMGISDRIVVVNFGQKIAEGMPGEIKRHPDVIRAYLGEKRSDQVAVARAVATGRRADGGASEAPADVIHADAGRGARHARTSGLLRIDGLVAGYGDIVALTDVSLQVEENRTVALIGSNGAGKSTLLKAISGLVKPRRGRIEFQGDRIDGLSPDRIIAKGIAHCPEGRRVFPDLTVRDNLELGAYLERSTRVIKDRMERIFDSFPILKERERQFAGTLSGGEQQQLALARSLMLDPKVILFDEPSLGLAPLLVEQVKAALIELKARGITILLVEQNANMALELADYAYVMETGAIILEGDASKLSRDPRVIEAYLGG